LAPQPLKALPLPRMERRTATREAYLEPVDPPRWRPTAAG